MKDVGIITRSRNELSKVKFVNQQSKKRDFLKVVMYLLVATALIILKTPKQFVMTKVFLLEELT